MKPKPITGQWIEARASAAEDRPSLDAGHVASWRTNGFTFVRDLFPVDLIDDLRAAASGVVPVPGSPEARDVSDFGGSLVFPSQISQLNQLTLHPRLLEAVAALLGTPIAGLRLTQSDLWPKYGREQKTAGALDNMDQRIHVDYPNHTLAHPAEWDRPEAVELIVYLSDVDVCGGPTAVVARRGDDDPAYRWPIVDSPGIADLDYVNDREAAERYFADRRPHLSDWRQTLYDREAYVAYKPGDVLFYRHDTWHRGTPMAPNALRLVQNLTFRRAECEWISTLHKGWSWSAYRRDKFMERLIAQASLDQRAVLGFPQPGASYWTEATIDAVGARYGVFGMDMAPYRAALAKDRS